MIELQKSNAQITFTTPTVSGGYVDLSDYYTKDEVDNLIQNVEVDLTGYATEDYVKEAIAAIPEVDLSDYAKKTDIPDTSGLASEKYVDNAIANLDIPEAEVDLSNYYSKAEVEALIPNTSQFITMANVEAKGYQTAAQVETAINQALGVIENGTY